MEHHTVTKLTKPPRKWRYSLSDLKYDQERGYLTLKVGRTGPELLA